MKTMNKFGQWRNLTYLFLLIAVVLTCVQIWAACSMQGITQQAMTQAERTTRKPDIDLQKARQDLVAAQVANQSRNFLETLAGQLGALIATLVTVSGAILALRTYLDDRDKERRDRADAREKERQDRLAASLSETLSRLVGTEARQRMVGAAGLLSFLEADKEEFHLQALTALIAAARVADERPEVRQSVRLGIERACRTVKPSILKRVSWQGVILRDANLSKQDLSEQDLRGADLQNADLREVRLDGSDLREAKLQGALLAAASLHTANLAYCDMAGADLSDACLASVQLDGVKVLKTELKGADLTGAPSGWRGIPWDVTLNWRQAKFDEPIRATLDAMYGQEAPNLKVLMLMWEMPPMVAGGTWTASYHLVRNLRRRGADVTVVVPWERDLIVDMPFGTDVEIVALGIKPPGERPATGSAHWSPYERGDIPLWSTFVSSYSPYTHSPYSAYSPYSYGSWSPYSTAWSPYGTAWSPYDAAWSTYSAYSRRSGPMWSPYAVHTPYGPSTQRRGSTITEQKSGLAGSTLFRLMGEFSRRLRAYILDHPTDVIHAHDWVTFDAARAAAEAMSLPWIAHFHSTEYDRQLDNADESTERIERSAVESANRIIAPSNVTAQRLIQGYYAHPDKITVAPNMLSEGAASMADMGRFETKRVVFIGRLTQQKGVDLFCEVARLVTSDLRDVVFEAFGEGEERDLLTTSNVRWRGPVGWDKRGTAFRDASVLLVPSRAEPFGMVILEAMQHRVPVIYPPTAGAAEVLESGIKLPIGQLGAISSQVRLLTRDLDAWESTVLAQADEIDHYPARDFERDIFEAWKAARGFRPVEN